MSNLFSSVVVYWSCTEDIEAGDDRNTTERNLANDQAWLNVTVIHFTQSSHDSHEPFYTFSQVSENCYKVGHT